jgi:hypothetical protein
MVLPAFTRLPQISRLIKKMTGYIKPVISIMNEEGRNTEQVMKSINV